MPLVNLETIYYSRAHEMAQRWALVADHFAPSGTMDKKLTTNHSAEISRLDGGIVFDDVSAHDSDGIAVVKNLTTRFQRMD